MDNTAGTRYKNRLDAKLGGGGVSRVRAAFVALAIAALASLSFASDRALKAAINGPHQLAFDSFGNLYVNEEYGNRVLRLDPTMANVTVIAGNGHQGCRKENVPARESSVYAVYSIAVDGHGNVYIGGRNPRDGAFVRIVHAATGKIETLARGGFPAGALSAKSSDANLSDPRGIVFTPEGKRLVSADESHVVVELGRATQLVAGTEGQKGFLGDGGPASLARFDLPGAMAVDGNGNVFVADYHNHRVRRIDAQTGIITTFAGNGSDVFLW